MGWVKEVWSLSALFVMMACLSLGIIVFILLLTLVIRHVRFKNQEWKKEGDMIAQLSVYPVGEGTSLSRFVRSGVSVIEQSGYPYEIGAMGTAVEVPDLDALFELVKKVHAAHVAEGARRVIIDLKVDDRRDKKGTIEAKKAAVKGA